MVNPISWFPSCTFSMITWIFSLNFYSIAYKALKMCIAETKTLSISQGNLKIKQTQPEKCLWQPSWKMTTNKCFPL